MPAAATVEPPPERIERRPLYVDTQPSPLAASSQPDVMYVPLAVTVGDGFKFGCGFFLATILTMLVGFVLLAALFVLTSLLGVSLPIGR
jgi:hypothetical protein